MPTAYSWCEFEKSQALQRAADIHFTKSTLLDGLDGTILLLLEVAWLPRPPLRSGGDLKSQKAWPLGG